MKRFFKFDVGASALAVAMSAGALAAGVAPASAQDGASSDEVVVTARRRDETVQTTPLSVTALSTTQLEQNTALNLQDFEGLAPNVVIDPVTAGPGGAGISIRGISFEDIEKSFDPAVGVIIDGVYIGTNTAQLLDFFDFESVEVLRGPQGTLFGRNTTAGVINIRRSRPTGEYGVKANVRVGEYGLFEGGAVVNVPIVEDKLAAKGFAFARTLDGWVKNVTRGGEGPEVDVQNYGVTFLFTPVDAFEAQFTVEQQTDDGVAALGSLSQSGLDLICAGFTAPSQCNRNRNDDLYTSFQNFADQTRFEQDAYTIELTWRVNDNWTVTSVTGYRESEESQLQDFDATSTRFFETRRIQDYEQTTQELRLAGNLVENFFVVIGGYYFDSTYTLDQSSSGVLFDPVFLRSFVTGESTSYAAFADADWNLTERLRLSAGARWTKDEKSILNRGAVELPGGVIVNNAGFPVSASDDWSEVTPRVSLDYKLTDANFVYGSWGRGFRSGGFNGRAGTPAAATQPYDPETVDSYEIGSKNRFFDNALTINVAAFYTKYEDKQEEVVRAAPPPVNQETVVQNAASATIKGLEAETEWRPVRNLTFRGVLGWLDAEYDEFRTIANIGAGPQTIDVSGRDLRRAPEWTGSVGAEYVWELGNGVEITPAATFRFIDVYATTITPQAVAFGFAGPPFFPTRASLNMNDFRGKTDSQHLLDASLTASRRFEDGKMIRASVFGRNLLDDRGLGSTLPVAGLFTFAGARAPRIVGVEVGLDF